MCTRETCGLLDPTTREHFRGLIRLKTLAAVANKNTRNFSSFSAQEFLSKLKTNNASRLLLYYITRSCVSLYRKKHFTLFIRQLWTSWLTGTEKLGRPKTWKKKNLKDFEQQIKWWWPSATDIWCVRPTAYDNVYTTGWRTNERTLLAATARAQISFSLTGYCQRLW